MRQTGSASAPGPAAQEVSCRCVIPFLQAAEQQGLDPTRLTEGLAIPLHRLRSTRSWIDWGSWTRFLENAGRLWSDSELEEIGTAMVGGRTFRAIAAISSLISSPADFVSWMSSSGSRRVFACIESDVRRIGPDEIELSQTLPDGYPCSREFWIINRAVHRAIPRTFGRPDADVEMKELSHGVRFVIRYPRAAPGKSRLHRWWTSLRWSRGAARELQEAYEELEQRCRELDAQVRARTRVEQENARWAAKVEEAQRLESLGVLAGGVAHDFNNILVGIQGNAELLLEEIPKGSQAASTAAAIVRSTQRASDLTRQLLAYAGRAQVSVERVELAGLVARTIDLVRNGVGRGAVIEHTRGSEPVWIEADATQMGQVVLNLIVNAVESSKSPGPVVRVHTGSVEATRDSLAQFRGGETLPEALYACIEVSDNGRGMSEAVLARIFEPFYTTKAQGRGLGLSATLGVVSAHDGAICVESTPEQGTRFRILLPTSLPAPEKRRGNAARTIRGSGTILVVDDEAVVRKVVERMLRGFGFEVWTAEDGEQAILRMQQEPGRIRAVVLDATMPGMDGRETFAALRRIRRDVPVLFYSGYTENEELHPVGAESVRFLQKPFSAAGLSESLQALLQPPA